MGQVEKKAGLQIRDPAQIVGMLIEFRVKGDYAPICIFQFAVQVG
jgi:hypothetical protein